MTAHVDKKTVSAPAEHARKAQHKAHPARPPRQGQSCAPLPPEGRHETVLVMDPLQLKPGVAASNLRQLGYRVLEANDAMDAQRLAHIEKKIHLLLMDLSTLETRHMELAMWFRAIYPEMKVLIASSSLRELNLPLSESKQIVLLAKPFTPLELACIVRRILD